MKRAGELTFEDGSRHLGLASFDPLDEVGRDEPSQKDEEDEENRGHGREGNCERSSAMLRKDGVERRTSVRGETCELRAAKSKLVLEQTLVTTKERGCIGPTFAGKRGMSKRRAHLRQRCERATLPGTRRGRIETASQKTN